jgi:hypothetical protein
MSVLVDGSTLRSLLALTMIALVAPAADASAACVSTACPDAAVVQTAREGIQRTCGCTRPDRTRRSYLKCAKDELQALNTLSRPCRKLVLRCESQSVCGASGAVVCCKQKKSGTVASAIRASAARCKTGNACDARLGFYSTFDACSADGTCTGLITEPTCEVKRAAFEATLPVPQPAAPGRYVVQLVNESSTTLLAAANAAHKAGDPPTPVLPREGKWDIPPGGVLTIDIPQEWEHTIGAGAVGPVFWARTGCRFDATHDLAQCETGSCSGIYDCSKANQSAPGPHASQLPQMRQG